jgi:hypothetical protein
MKIMSVQARRLTRHAKIWCFKHQNLNILWLVSYSRPYLEVENFINGKKSGVTTFEERSTNF